MKQLQRTFNGKKYYCEYAGSDYFKAIKKREAVKYCGGLARLIKTRKEYQVFVN